MSWRLLVVSSPAKLSYKNDFLVVRSKELRTVHLSEIVVLLIETNTFNITGMLLSELAKWNIVVLTCDERRMPTNLMMPLYGHHKVSHHLQKQIKWSSNRKNKAWQYIIMNKIQMQAENIKDINMNLYEEMYTLSKKVSIGDRYNAEAQAAQQYFKPLFGDKFKRDPQKDCGINQCLNYTYAILLSMTVRNILSQGYCSQLGIFHHNGFNNFNLASDLMEPFRPLADRKVYSLKNKELSSENKRILAEIVNDKISIQGKKFYLNNAMHVFVKSVIDYLNEDSDKILEIGGLFCDS